jgi:uncharacterized membrane protein
MREFLKTTIIGGLLFLLPLALIVFILGYAVTTVTKALQPISKTLGLDRMAGDLGGVGVATLGALVVLVLVSFTAGIIARTTFGGRFVGWLEDKLQALPQYRLIKGMAQGLVHVETARDLKPALIGIEGGWQLGFVLESLDNGWVAVFLPLAPSGVSGHVMYVAADRVRPLGITMGEAMGVVNGIGAGSAKALRGANLNLPGQASGIARP